MTDDRRQHSEVRLRLSHLLSEGWLGFKADHERRRLSPIPANWEALRGPDLRALWEQAEVIGTKNRELSA